ncbi:DNA polymerase III alpha subunit [Pseudomonas orientalis]|nr:DNA polymerase III alpha subunit [Pseudomonas orientalis]
MLFCRSELAREKRTFNAAMRLEYLREQARSYSGCVSR